MGAADTVMVSSVCQQRRTLHVALKRKSRLAMRRHENVSTRGLDGKIQQHQPSPADTQTVPIKTHYAPCVGAGPTDLQKVNSLPILGHFFFACSQFLSCESGLAAASKTLFWIWWRRNFDFTFLSLSLRQENLKAVAHG